MDGFDPEDSDWILLLKLVILSHNGLNFVLEQLAVKNGIKARKRKATIFF